MMIPFRVLSSGVRETGQSRAGQRLGAANNSTIVIIVAVVGGFVLCVGLLIVLLIPGVRQAREAARQAQSANNLKIFGIALHYYHEVHEVFPPGGVYDEEGAAYRSWQTCLLPYIDQGPLYDSIKADLPWTDPVNDANFRVTVTPFLHPSESSEPYTAAGYAVSHYAGNSHVFFPNSSIGMLDFVDGSFYTLLAGEVGAGYKAWGDPTNVRDPAVGIRVGPETFGRDDADPGANMLFGDGSVHFISGDIDPDVLAALATYDGGEEVGDF